MVRGVAMDITLFMHLTKFKIFNVHYHTYEQKFEHEKIKMICYFNSPKIFFLCSFPFTNSFKHNGIPRESVVTEPETPS